MNFKQSLYRLFALIAVFSSVVTVSAQQKNHNFEVTRNLETLSAIYKNLDLMYVDSLDPNVVIGRGIKAMLNALDPYTEYYPEDEVKNLKTMLTGKYAGIGSTVRKNLKSGKVVIDMPYAGMPAAEVGLMKGDEILSIDDTTMVGKDVSYVSSHLRGDAGTTFLLRIFRPSLGKEMKLKVTRRAIQMPCVPYYGMLNETIGYINLDSFTDDCSTDVRRAFIDLKHKGMQGLVFDLRNNGGGSLQEAVKIVNMFVPKDVTIVTQKGRLKRANHEYKTEQEPLDTLMPIVVLVNGNTASASEITAGSLQDLDRATILGTRTYGKGLVQLPLELPHNGSMKLTISKYYIPSGRCIQAIDYNHKGGGTRVETSDSLKHIFYTKNGRKVKDGSGITPDIEVKADSLPNIAFYLVGGGIDSTEVAFTWVTDYIAQHKTIAPARDFKLTDEEYADFKTKVLSSGFKYDQETSRFFEDLVKIARFEGYYDNAKAEFDALKSRLTHNLEQDLDNNQKIIRHILESDIISAYYYQAGAIESQNTYDTQVQKAIETISQR